MSQTNRKSNWLNNLFTSLLWRNLSLRTKLILVFIAVALTPLSIITLLNNNSTRTALTNDANTALLAAASTTATQLDTFITQGLAFVGTEAQLPDFIAFLSLPASERADNADEVTAILSVLTQQDPTYISSISLLDRQGIALLDTFTADVGINKADRDYFKQAIETGQPYASEVEFSRTTGDASIYFSAPVRNESGKIIGVFRIRYNASILQEYIAANVGLVGANSYPVLLNANHVRLAEGNDPALIFKSIIPLDAATVGDLQAKLQLPPGSPQELSTDLPGFEAGVANSHTQSSFAAELEAEAGDTSTSTDTVLEQAAVAPMKTQSWVVVFAQSQDVFLAPINTQVRNNIVLTLALGVVVALFGLFVAQTLTGPIVRLTKVAETVSGGDMNAQAQVESKDEIGTLAGAFNSMTAQLRDFIGTLEGRVAERTHSLELAAEVGRSVSQVRALDVMLKDAAEIIRSRFDLYYTQVYLTNPAQNTLLLQSGTGTVGAELVGRGHQLPMNIASINGRAAVEKRSVVISDTTASATFRPNPLLPDTRSEMAIPLMVGEEVVGVLDLQSQKIGTLNEESLPAFEALAGSLAIAIQNASLLAEAEQARADMETQARRLVRANWEDYLDAIHKPEHTGFMFEHNQVIPLDAADESHTENALTAPIAITGEPIGSLVVELNADQKTAQNVELVNVVARQVAQQIENLRLLDSAERYRLESEQAAHRITREGWKTYMESASGKLGYMYNLNEVVPVEPDRKASENAITLPIKVRDDAVGKIALIDIDQNDGQAIELANAVAERLSAHIEGLRQFDQTQSALAQSEKLFEASRQLTQTTDLQGLVRATVESLNIPEIDRAVLGILHSDSGEEPDGMTITANWASNISLQATPIGTYYPKEALKTLSLFMGPEPLFFNDMLNDERIDEKMQDIPKRLNYRSVAALPLFSGSRHVAVLLLEGKKPHNFTQDEIRLFAALAPQIATVLENRRQYERAHKQAERESTLNVISQKIQNATTVEAVLQIAARELGHALGAPLTIAQLGIKDKK
jgi:GAF domain-containing protein/HAMP domain-containing protein